jgi:hypothetical protein
MTEVTQSSDVRPPKSVTMQNAGFILTFEFEGKTAELAPSAGNSWNDPDLPETWESKSGAVGQIDRHVA